MGELDIVFPVSPVSESEHESSDVGAEDDDDPVDDHQAGQEAQEQQPEPDKDVDLLVNCNDNYICIYYHHHDCVTSGQQVLFQHSYILTLPHNRPIWYSKVK